MSQVERRRLGLALAAVALATLTLCIALCAVGARSDDKRAQQTAAPEEKTVEAVPHGTLITTWTGVDRPIRAIGANLPGRDRFLAVLDADGGLTVWEIQKARIKQRISLGLAPERARLRLEPEREVLHVRLAAVDDGGRLLAAHYRGRYGALFSEQRDGCHLGPMALDGSLLALGHTGAEGVTLHRLERGFSPCRPRLPSLPKADTTEAEADPPPAPKAHPLPRGALWLGSGSKQAEALALVRTASSERRGRSRERYRLAVGTAEHHIEIWEIAHARRKLQGTRLERLRGHQHRLRDLRFARGGDLLISLDAGGTILRWDLDRQPVVARRQLRLEAMPSTHALLTLDEAGQRVGYVDADGRARVVDLDDRGRVVFATPPLPDRPPTALHLTAKALVVARDDPPVLEFWGEGAR